MKELWKARSTILDLIEDRGFTTILRRMDFNEFMNNYGTSNTNTAILNFIATHKENNRTIAVHFTNDDKLSKKGLESLVTEYTAQNVSTVILVTFEKLNPACKSLLKTCKIPFEHFMLEELLFNPSKHELVPKHRILSADECEALLQKLKSTKQNIPVILTTDPMARYYGAVDGDVFEIIRKSETAGISYYYRVVRTPLIK